jgi:transcriptional regulator with XRE-family HTH domain
VGQHTEPPSPPSPSDAAESLNQRIMAAVGTRSYRHVGDLTKTHPETVRRYLTGQTVPGVEFIAQLASSLAISTDWLLTGRGPMKAQDLKAHALATADTSELLHAMSNTIARLIDRVERVETYVQTLETRVRAHQASGSHIDLPSASRTSTDLLSSPSVGPSIGPSVVQVLPAHPIVVEAPGNLRQGSSSDPGTGGTPSRAQRRSPGGGS